MSALSLEEKKVHIRPVVTVQLEIIKVKKCHIIGSMVTFRVKSNGSPKDINEIVVLLGVFLNN
mgnify:CR=1 FL=1